MPSRPRSLPTPSVSRRSALALAGAGAGALGLAACSSGDEVSRPKSDASEFIPPNTVEAPAVDGLISSDVEGVPPMMIGSPKEYFASVEEKPAAGGTLSTFQILWGAPVLEREDNQVWQKLEEELGIDTLNATMVPDSSFSDKLATTLASGDLPDLVHLDDNNPNAARAIQDGAFVALNEYLEGDLIEQYPNLATTPQSAWEDSHKNGTLYGIPQPAAAINWFPAIRKDAMEQIGLTDVPQDGSELREMLVEFGKIGTLGGRKVWGVGALDAAIFEPIFALGPEYQVRDGEVTTKYHLPEYEQFLEYMADLWSEGVFHPDALGQVDPELFAQGQTLYYSASFAGYYWIPDLGRVNLVKRAVPTAEVTHFVVPAMEGGPGQFVLSKAYGAIVGFSRDKADSPERVEELLRICNYYRAPFGSNEAKFLQYGIEGRNFTVGDGNAIEPIEDAPNEGHVTYSGLLQNPVNSLPAKNEDLADNVRQTLEGMASAGVKDELITLPSEARARHQTKLTEIQQDYFNGIVSGRRPVSDIADLRSSLLSNGGQEILDEYSRLLEDAE
ncbi:extracellular solute-binding protein [Brachybacterium sp. AOP43-C2-M15]|uniref:extracellular solute-binding protein n=1 Tax=Brachybacterium sp. AOP43-C2-M15 TaxID=3457661 RepID=UPI0040331BD1